MLLAETNTGLGMFLAAKPVTLGLGAQGRVDRANLPALPNSCQEERGRQTVAACAQT